jgi:exodeoxyribonuclease VII small subunit
MTTTTDVQTLSFEEALAELEMLIAQLERGDIKLNDAVQAYQRGSHLASRCAQLLDETEAAVTQLVVGPQGALQERPFAAAGAEAATPPSPSSPSSRPAPRPVAPPPPTAPLRARAGARPAAGTETSAPSGPPDLFPGLEPTPAPRRPDDPPEFDLDDIPF